MRNNEEIQNNQSATPSKFMQFFAGLFSAMCVNYATDGIANQLQQTGLLHGNDVNRFQDDLKYNAQQQIISHYQNNDMSLQGHQNDAQHDHQ